MTSSSMLEGAIEYGKPFSPPPAPSIKPIAENIPTQSNSSNLFRNILILLLLATIVFIFYKIYKSNKHPQLSASYNNIEKPSSEELNPDSQTEDAQITD